jgi:hypothetical protein
VIELKKNDLNYLAGIFDVRGFINFRPETYHYYITFNFYENEKNLWKEIAKVLKNLVPIKIYRYKKRKKEYQIYIGGKRNVWIFLNKILPFSLRKNEIATIIDLLEKKGYKKWKKDMEMFE